MACNACGPRLANFLPMVSDEYSKYVCHGESFCAHISPIDNQAPICVIHKKTEFSATKGRIRNEKPACG